MSQLRQAVAIINSAWQRNLTYRFTVAMYRLGEIIEVLVLILMWSAIYAAGTTVIKGFTLNEMITYVLIGNVFAAAVRNFLAGNVSRIIESGALSMFLVRPVSFIKYIFINELGRSFLATVLSVLTQITMVFFFLDRVVINNSPGMWVIVVVTVFFAFVIELLLGFLIGSIAFWTDETDGLHSMIERVKRFFSGGYFPLALLPVSLATVSFYLPFQYSFYAPAMLYMGKLSLGQGVIGLLVQLVWIVLLAILVGIVWKLGLKRYEAVGS